MLFCIFWCDGCCGHKPPCVFRSRKTMEAKEQAQEATALDAEMSWEAREQEKITNRRALEMKQVVTQHGCSWRCVGSCRKLLLLF